MPDQFLHQPVARRLEVLRTVARKLRRDPIILEKDIWTCQALQSLFSIPNAHPMVFKGGTSLSKVYGIVNRLSEDVDITLDHRSFNDEFDPFAEGVSRKAIKRFTERLQNQVSQYAEDVIIPHIKAELEELPGPEQCEVSLLPDGETVQVRYPSVITEGDDYIKRHILIELGGRGDIEPNERHIVKTDIAESVDDLVFPECEAVVLSAERTFWEKVLLAHKECHRKRMRENMNRRSRHWYDLKMLAGHAAGKSAIGNHRLLEDVVRHERVFFKSSYANYEDCLSNKIRLIPDNEALDALRDDYNLMRESRMIYDEPVPSFNEIIADLRQLEQTLNTH